MNNGSQKKKQAVKLPFECPACSQRAKKDFDHFAPVDDWHCVYPDLQLVHLHYGKATWDEDVSNDEAHWILAQSQKACAAMKGKPMFVLVDLTRSDDSEFPSDESMRVHSAIIANPQIDRIVCYGVTPGMRTLLNVLSRLGKNTRKITIVKEYEAANALHTEWLDHQKK